MNANRKIAFVVWASGEAKVSHFIARDLGAKIIISYIPKWGKFSSPICIRYIRQFFDTWKKLKIMQPTYIWVQNPPIFAALIVWIFAKKYGSQFIIDTHTAGFIDKKWRWFFPVDKFLSIRALYNTVHNYKNLEILKTWNVRNARVFQFYTPNREEILFSDVSLPNIIREKLATNALKIFMVNRFASDDAFREVIATAKVMPEATFFITGKARKHVQLENIPQNVFFTGFLDHKQFIKLMDECDVALALTKRNDTVLWSIREILALKKPFVTSETEVLKKYFSQVAIFSDHSPENLKQKILEAKSNEIDIKKVMEEYIEQDKKRWKKDIEFFRSLMK